MILKLLGKILIRAALPVVGVIGITSYMVYLKGGDPLSLVRVAGRVFEGQASKLGSSAKDTTEGALSTLRGYQGTESRSTELYRWTDSSGTTHFANVPPGGSVNAVHMTVDPDRNMIPTRKATPTRVNSSHTSQSPDLSGSQVTALPELNSAAILEKKLKLLQSQ